MKNDNRYVLMNDENVLAEASISEALYVWWYVYISVVVIVGLVFSLSEEDGIKGIVYAISFVLNMDTTGTRFMIFLTTVVIVVITIIYVRFLKRHTFLIVTNKRVIREHVGPFGIDRENLFLEDINTTGTLYFVFSLLRLFFGDFRSVKMYNSNSRSFLPVANCVENYDEICNAVMFGKEEYYSSRQNVSDYQVVN